MIYLWIYSLWRSSWVLFWNLNTMVSLSEILCRAFNFRLRLRVGQQSSRRQRLYCAASVVSYLPKRMDWRTAVVMEAVVFLGLLASAFVETHGSRLPAPCDNEIYCISRPDSLLHVVQMARLYKDSKTFVDKAVKTSPNVVLQNFQEMMKVCLFFLSISYLYYIFYHVANVKESFPRTSPPICQWKFWPGRVRIWAMAASRLAYWH